MVGINRLAAQNSFAPYCVKADSVVSISIGQSDSALREASRSEMEKEIDVLAEQSAPSRDGIFYLNRVVTH
jgi:hypothetical protein